MTPRVLKVLTMAILPLVISGCMFYHESAFHGTIRDVDTKQPIEGAVVVVEYKKETMNIFGGGSGNSIINVRETLTDKDGRFSIPSYTTVVDPFSWKTNTIFIIFKPGYVNLGYGLSEYFSVKDYRQEEYPWNNKLIVKFPGNGVVELPSVKSREDRDKVLFGVRIPPDVPSKLMPILLRIYNEEKTFLGLEPISLP